MLVIFRIMSTVKSPGAFSIFTMDIFCITTGFIFAHDKDVRFDKLLIKCSCLSHKSLYDLFMILAKAAIIRAAVVCFGVEFERHFAALGIIAAVFIVFNIGGYQYFFETMLAAFRNYAGCENRMRCSRRSSNSLRHKCVVQGRYDLMILEVVLRTMEECLGPAKRG